MGTALYGKAKFSAKPKMKSVSFLQVYNLKFHNDILKKKSQLEIIYYHLNFHMHKLLFQIEILK